MKATRKVVGIHAVASLLRNDAQSLLKLCVKSGRRDRRLQALLVQAEQAGIAIELLDAAGLTSLAGGDTQHQGVVGFYREPPQKLEADLWVLLDSLDEPPLLLVLDGVTDPHNLGACLRSADATGVHAVIVPKDNAVGLTPTVRKVASGAADSIPLISVTNLARTLEALQQRGCWVVGTSDDAQVSLFDQTLTGALVWVMGAEGKGLRRLTRERCDYLVAIPMLGQVPSLNVSVATGVCLYETLRQRRT